MRLAARGARETETGVEPIQNPDEVRQLRRQATRVYVKGVAAAVLVTGLAMLARGLFGA